MQPPPFIHESHEPNVIAGWVTAVAQACDASGLSSQEIFAEAGIDIGELRNPTARFPISRMGRLYDLIGEATGDPSFGLRIAEFVHPTTMHALGYSLFASSTLESFCRRIVRYFRLVSTNAESQLERTASEYRLVMVPTQQQEQYYPQDAWMATILRYVREIYRPDFAPLGVCLTRPLPQRNAQRFEKYFGCEVRFGCDANRLIFSPADMHADLPAANAELARRNDEVVMSLLARMDREDIITRLRALIVELLPSGECSKEATAGRLNMSERSLQSKLAARGTSYRILLNETRKELAEQYMRQGRHSVSEVTYLLGFADVSSFSRAFRNWTGVSPSEFRERSLRRV
jgi:AraC-like DNA-binding protein